MKTRRGWMVAMAGAALAGHVAAQDIEADDMYFRAKDREKLNSQRVIASNTRVQRNLSEVNEVIAPINPTDSYSARGVNPEHLGIGSSAQPSYFRPGYQPASALAVSPSMNNFNNFNGWNNGFNRWGMMPGMGFGMGMGPGMGWGNGFGSPWGWNDPFWGGGFGPGWGSSISLGWGTGWNNWGMMPGMGFGMGMGPGMGMGWGNGFGNPWGWNGFGGGWGWNSFGGGWNRPIVIVNGGDNTPVYSTRRQDRSSSFNNYYDRTGRTSGGAVTNGAYGSDRQVVSGRSRGSAPANSYNYDRNWRSNPNNTSSSYTRSAWSSDGGNRSGYTNSGTGSRNYNSGSRSSGSDSWSAPSRSAWDGGSRSSFSSGGGSRSSGGSYGGGGYSGGGSRSRGRD
ncbi:MAG: hypothetical protein MUC38_04945 [Cyclobacteriaceae bacterium]|nr:hypothetical protein [Cyclobacteriaceae bacterium]